MCILHAQNVHPVTKMPTPSPLPDNVSNGVDSDELSHTQFSL